MSLNAAAFNLFKTVKHYFPGFQGSILNMARDMVSSSGYMYEYMYSKNVSKGSLIPFPFQFPVSAHPLVEIIDVIESVKNDGINADQFATQFSELRTILDRSSKVFQAMLSETDQLSKFLNILNQSMDKEKIYKEFVQLSQHFRNLLAGYVYEFSNDPWKGGDEWGMKHALDDLQCLKLAAVKLIKNHCLLPCQEKIKEFAIRKLQLLSPEDRNQVYASIYYLAGRPSTSDFQWGEHHATEDAKRLISALHCQAKIEGPYKWAEYLKNWEVPEGNFSRYFTIKGKELACGEIGYINGAGTPLSHAIGDAQRIQESYCHGHAMHCIYTADQGRIWDAASVALSQSLHILPETRLLIQRWTEFFAKAGPDEKYLQMCMSRGAADVVAALKLLPDELKQRIIVIAAAPAYIVERHTCYKAVNLVIKEDAVPFLAPNSSLIGRAEEVKILPNHSDCQNPHELQGSSYRKAIGLLLDQYIRTNDIDPSSI
jgi:hypothetical protein